ncbi:hypothetical protein, partial [Plasmodium yoelii yoelii]
YINFYNKVIPNVSKNSIFCIKCIKQPSI